MGYTAAVVLVDPRSAGLCDLGKLGLTAARPWSSGPTRRPPRSAPTTSSRSVPPARRWALEWTIAKGNLVLRVTGDLTPSVEKAYEAAFTG